MSGPQIIAKFQTVLNKAKTNLKSKQKSDASQQKLEANILSDHILSAQTEILKKAEADTEKNDKILKQKQDKEMAAFEDHLKDKLGHKLGRDREMGSNMSYKDQVNKQLIGGVKNVVDNAYMARQAKREKTIN